LLADHSVCGLQPRFPIVDVLLRSGDIRDQQQRRRGGAATPPVGKCSFFFSSKNTEFVAGSPIPILAKFKAKIEILSTRISSFGICSCIVENCNFLLQNMTPLVADWLSKAQGHWCSRKHA